MQSALELPPLKPVRILVAGEVVLDRYLWGEVSRISPEAPIPILQVNRREERCGNAAFVCANLAAFGATATALSVIGADSNGQALTAMLAGLGVETHTLVEDPGRLTIVKERLLGSVQSTHRAIQQLLRVDNEDPRPLSTAAQAEMLARQELELERADGVLVCDINKGLLTPAVLKALIEGAKRRGTPVVIDPRMGEDFSIYRGAFAMTPNRYETERATGIGLEDPKAWPLAARKLVEDLELSSCLITLDRDGMFLAGRDGTAIHISTAPREVYDVTGAGDVVLATFGLFLIAGADPEIAARLANAAAGLEVGKQGAAVVSRAELAAALAQSLTGSRGKVLTLAELLPVLEGRRREGLRVCFTNGCFDLLHAGHIESLEFARAQGDLLVVGLNSDASVRQIKGEGRPVYPAADRARILAALEAVDYVVIFDEVRAENIIRAVRPDVLVKGEDWQGKVVDGSEFVQSYGGRVILAKLLEGRATSGTIQRLRNAQAQK
ncbi:MAG TPA: bifunctional heptose 7-phosphate kinase/heptose 1-phosphate adenyltransferase [Candidatus Binataceae bacterium]|jgi:D-beta-D-heptose 7-phosphate kinase/D-beta-D-heptose 1-phosphate adenosyltransferase|nr:bifunctional heptose 7-phosphate kinase/heptose 1-phosphate adenyltransferase [Candidatus Binataceae bacterium]